MPMIDDEDIRISGLPETEELVSGMKVAVDSVEGGTQCVDVSKFAESTFAAVYGVTTYEELDAAYQANKTIIVKYQPSLEGNPNQVEIWRFCQFVPGAGFMFETTRGIANYRFIVCNPNSGWIAPTTYQTLIEDNTDLLADGPATVKVFGTTNTGTHYAGYAEILTAKSTVAADNIPEQTPKVSLTKYVMSSSQTPDADQFVTSVDVSAKDSNGNAARFGGNLLPSIVGGGSSSGKALKVWNDGDGKGDHLGWRSLNEVPASTAQDEGKILSVDSNGVPEWIASPDKVSVYEIHASGWPLVYTYPSATSVRNDVTAGKVVLLKFIIDNESCTYYSIDKLDSSTGDIIFYPSTSACDTATAFMLSQSGVWSNQEVDMRLLPIHTSSDIGKVLTVDSNGAAAWASSGGGTEKFIIRGLVYRSSATYIDNDKAVVDKTTTEIRAAYESGQELELQFYVIDDTTITSADIASKFAEKQDSLAPFTADLSFAYIPDTSGNIRFGFTFRSSEKYNFVTYYYQGMPSAYEYTRLYSEIHISVSRYSSDDSDWISASSYANDLGKWQIQVDYWADNTTETYGENWDYFYDTVRYYMKNHNSIDLRLDIDSTNTPRYVAHLSDYLFSNNSSYPPLLLFTHLYVPACLQGQAYRTEARWFKFYPLEEVDPDTGETVKVCKLSYGKIKTQPMLPNLMVNNSSGFTISSSPWILPENNTYITPTIDSSLTELVILVSKDTIGFNAASNPQFTMKFSLSGGRTLRVRIGEQYDGGGIGYFSYDADKGRDLVSPSGVYSTYFVIKVVGTTWTFEKLAADSNS